MAPLLNLNTEEPEELKDYLSLDVGPYTVPLSPEVAGSRAFKAYTGLAGLGKSYTDIYDSLSNGNEESLRREMAAEVDRRKSLAKIQFMTEVARNKGSNLTPQEKEHVNQTFLGLSKGTDHTSVFEEYFSKEFMDLVEKTGMSNPDSSMYKAIQDIPNTNRRALKTGTLVNSQREFAITLRENVKEEMANQSIIGRVADEAKSFFPGYTQLRSRGYVPESDFKLLLGDQLFADAGALLDLPFDQYKSRLTDIVNDIKKDNPSLAKTFLDAVVGQTSGERLLTNAFSGLDYLDLAGVGKLVGKLAGKTASAVVVNNAYKSALKAAGDSPETTKALMHEAAGDIGEAGVQRAVDKLSKDLGGAPEVTKDAIESLPSAMRADIEATKSAPGKYGVSMADRITTATLNTVGSVMNAIANVIKVERIPSVIATEKVFRAIKEGSNHMFPGLDHNMLDAVYAGREPFSNSHFINYHFGYNNGELFHSKDSAESFAKAYGLVSTVEQKGTGFYINVTKSLRETDDIIRDAITKVKDPYLPDSWLSAWTSRLSRARTPEEILELEHRVNRKAAVYGANVITKVMKENQKEIEKLGKWSIPGTKKRERWNDFHRVVENLQTFPDPARGGKSPLWFTNPKDLEAFYQQFLKRLPDEQEIAAYFAFKRNMQLEDMLLQVAHFRNRAREGVEQHSFHVLKENGERVDSPFFEGTVLRDLPGGDEAILMVGRFAGDARIITASPFNVKVINELKDKITKGELTLIKLFTPEARPLSGWEDVANTRIHYVVTPFKETKPLAWSDMPKKEGKLEYDYNWYIKQAKVVREQVGQNIKHWYEGDTTIMPISNRAMGQQIVKHLEEVRVALKDGNEELAMAAAAKLPIAWKELRSWFKPQHDPDSGALAFWGMGKDTPPKLNIDEPIQVVGREKLIVDSDNALAQRYAGTFKDGTRSGLPRKYHYVADEPPVISLTRDPYEVFTIKDYGTRHNPLFSIAPGKPVDPMVSMQRAINKATSSAFLDDYKFYAVEHWIRDASKYLDTFSKTDAELRSAPFFHFSNPKFLPNVPAEIINTFKARHYQISQLLGLMDETDTLMHSVSQLLYDSVYGRLGGRAAHALDPTEALPKLVDPTRFIRSMTFHAKLGLFNIPQLLVQAQTFVTIAGISGMKYAAPGTKAMLLEQWSRMNKNPEILDHLDKLAGKFQIPGSSIWRPGEWKEAHELLERTGFGIVGNEYALLDMMQHAKLITSGKQTVLDAGTVFFREGERSVRYGAWYTSYREFRDRVPNGRITETNLKEILERADILTVNMSRASSSMLHSGIWSIPTQFLAYQLRSFELFMGKRLTPVEKARLLATYATFYGAPTALGVTGFPAGEYFRKAAIESNYVVGEKFLDSLFMEGLPAYLMSLVSGTWYNVGDRYGVQGFESIKDVLRGDKKWWELIGGAAFSTFKGTFEGLDGFTNAMISAIRDDGASFPIRPEDFLDPFKEVSSVNNTWKMLAAFNTAKYFSKKETYIDDTSPANAIIGYLTGLQDRAAQDANVLSWSLKDQKEHQTYAEKQFTKEWRRGLHTLETNPNQAHKYFTRALTELHQADYPQEKFGDAIAKAVKDHESLVKRLEWKFYVKEAPSAEKDDRQRALSTKTQLRENR